MSPFIMSGDLEPSGGATRLTQNIKNEGGTMDIKKTIVGYDLSNYPHSFFVVGKGRARDFQRMKETKA